MAKHNKHIFKEVECSILCEDYHINKVTHHEEEWESYFNFNLMTRGFIADSNWIMSSSQKGGSIL